MLTFVDSVASSMETTQLSNVDICGRTRADTGQANSKSDDDLARYPKITEPAWLEFVTESMHCSQADITAGTMVGGATRVQFLEGYLGCRDIAAVSSGNCAAESEN